MSRPRVANRRMRAISRDYRRRMLEPLRLIHPVHYADPTYRTCYERFFQVTGIPCTEKVLSEIAKLPELLPYRHGYKKRRSKKIIEEDEPIIQGPSKELLQGMDHAMHIFKPGDFDTAGFDEDDSKEVTEESLIVCRGNDLVLLSE